MATLKEHQAAMVDLLANGSGIPASASRLAHAMHDVLATILAARIEGKPQRLVEQLIGDESNYGVNNLLLKVGATTPGLNDKALSKREKALKTDSPAKWPTPAEQRVKELENTIKQLKAQNAKQRKDIAFLKMDNHNQVAKLRQELKAWDYMDAEFRKPYLPGCETSRLRTLESVWCHMSGAPEQAGCRKDDTQGCEHTADQVDEDTGFCSGCGKMVIE